MARAVSVTELLTKKRKIMHFTGRWHATLGDPELAGTWFIWGNPANGKTSFALQLCKYLSCFERVAYNSLEEGDSESMRRAFMIAGMEEVKSRVVLLDNEPIDELIERLKRHKSPNIIVIDSVQYTGMSYADYKKLRNTFRNKLFIFISHAEGKEPAGKVARSIRYDAGIKIWVEGYRAFARGRYGGGEPYTIWEQRAGDYYAMDNN